jgi:hypothetical protein
VTQIGCRQRVAGTDLERQFALTGNALGLFLVAHRPGLAAQRQLAPGLQFGKGRQRFAGMLQEAKHILTGRLR